MSHDAFEELHQEVGLLGVGALALVRLLGMLGGVVVSLAFFSLEPSGEICFLTPHELSAQRGEHVVVTVNTADGTQKQLWFICHNTRTDNPSVDAFCRLLHPTSLLIKAAPDSLWVPPTPDTPLDDSQAYRRCIQRSLEPAARSNCAVVSDSCQADPAAPPAIYKRPPQQRDWGEHDDGEDEVFGYGTKVFLSRGDDLQGGWDER